MKILLAAFILIFMSSCITTMKVTTDPNTGVTNSSITTTGNIAKVELPEGYGMSGVNNSESIGKVVDPVVSGFKFNGLMDFGVNAIDGLGNIFSNRNARQVDLRRLDSNTEIELERIRLESLMQPTE